ncbi:hypothetical protein OQA88_6962 [Cercophora sp. LCS_1]
MPPKKAASAMPTRETKARGATKKTAPATKATSKAATKAADEEPATTTKKAAAAKKTDAKKVAAPKPAPKTTAKVTKTAPKKATKTSKTKASEESDKENVGTKKAAAAAAKRKRDAEESADEDVEMSDANASEDEADKRPVKRAKTAAKPAAPVKKIPAPKAAPKPKPKPKPKPAPTRVAKAKKVINTAPTQVMDIFVFGEGSSGELGLGSVKYDGKLKPIDVKRPRINNNLKNIVQVACGGMHVAALTTDNKILTWGVNDQGALGRDTTWDGGLRNVEDEDSDSEDEDDTGLNPRESTPTEIDLSGVPEGTRWTQVVTSDSATFALTETGDVYGWGTFRNNEGIMGFTKETKVQKTPVLVHEVTKIKQLAAGSNHVLALDEKNKIIAWGAGQQAQLARRLLERDDCSGLLPSGIGSLPGRAKVASLSCGSYHSFVVDTSGRTIGWGLNNYAELGIEAEAGTDGGFILRPALIESLGDVKVVDIAGGEHHSLACTDDGQLLTWGRIDGHQTGQPESAFDQDNTIWDDKNKPRILLVPSPVQGLKDVIKVAAGTDHSFAITKEGKVYSWGFSANYQTGQGTTDDIGTPTLIDNTAIRDRKIIWAGAGGQYSVLGAEAK